LQTAVRIHMVSISERVECERIFRVLQVIFRVLLPLSESQVMTTALCPLPFNQQSLPLCVHHLCSLFLFLFLPFPFPSVAGSAGRDCGRDWARRSERLDGTGPNVHGLHLHLCPHHTTPFECFRRCLPPLRAASQIRPTQDRTEADGAAPTERNEERHTTQQRAKIDAYGSIAPFKMCGLIQILPARTPFRSAVRVNQRRYVDKISKSRCEMI
jgi:hypothetical protein